MKRTLGLLAAEAMIMARAAPGGISKPAGGFMVALLVPAADGESVASAGGWDPSSGKTWPGMLHATISYVEHGDQAFARAVSAVGKVAETSQEIELVTTVPGFFGPSDDNPGGVHWVGIAGPGLEALAASVRRALTASGLSHDEKHPVFAPHVTIEYMKEWREAEILARLDRAGGEPPVRFVPTLAVVDGSVVEKFRWSSEGAFPFGNGDGGAVALGDAKFRKLAASEALGNGSGWFVREASVAEADRAGVDPEVGKSSLHKHMVRAVSASLRKRGEAPKDAASGAFKIAASVLRRNGMQGAGSGGRLTAKGAARSREHAAEPAGTRAAKDADYAKVRKLAGG